MRGNHLKHMFIAGGALLAVLLLVGLPLGRALQSAVVLACPLMMVAMMAMMGRGRGRHAPAKDDGAAPPQSADDPVERSTFDARR